MYSDELKKCACGGMSQVEHKNYLFFVMCKDCGTSGAAYPTQIQAVRSWNKKVKRLKGEYEK